MNIINVNFKNRYSALVSESRYQYDYGQVLLFEGLDLPPAYEVHFSNREDLGESITQIGTPDGVPVPDEMFLSGKDIYAFTYLHKGSSDGRTMYKVKIPVKKRPKPTDQEITPVEQSALDQALAAFEQAAAPLPEAARKAEAAIHTYPKIIDGHWYVWDVDTEAFVDTGVESTGEQGIGIANIVHNDDHTLTITLTNGETYTTDPVKGDKGDKGDRGLTGNGIASTNLNSNYSLTITFTDGTTYTTPPIRGKEGKAGFSPQITVGAVGENRHIVTITDASGTKSFSIYDGVQGPKGDRGDPTDVQIDGTSIVEDGVANIPLTSSLRPGVVKTSNSIASLPDGAIGVVPASVDMLKSLSDNERAITSGRLHHGVFYGLAKVSGDTTQSQSDNPVGNYTVQAKAAIQEMLNVPDKSDIPDVPVEDVQINGTSIVNDGVANVPIATTNEFGVMKYGAGFKLNSSNQLTIDGAGSNSSKTGTSTNYPVIPAYQHYSTFYGLTKAAGVDMSNSSNPVGAYTPQAKTAIQDMLDVHSKEYVDDLPSEIVKISDTEPSSTNSRIWIQGSDEEYEIPTMDEVVQDVQINGTSIVSDGVANVPVASGVVWGVSMMATDAKVKVGTDYRSFLTPARNQLTAFYGLAKAAGVDMANSTNAVGEYTEEAKIAIQKMLGIYEAPWELIREDTFTNETEADHIITVDGNGEEFELTDVLLILAVPTHSEDTTIGDYGRVYFYNGNTNIKTLYFLNASSKVITANSIENTGVGQITQEGALVRSEVYLWNVRTTRASRIMLYGENEAKPDLTGAGNGISFLSSKLIVTSLKIGKITGQMRYRLYGKRKWQ